MDTAQNIFLVVVWIALSIIFLLLLNYFWPAARRRAHNDVIGWQLAILGTIYAVMIGFMLYAVWANFQTAETNIDGEANAVGDLYRTADALPDAQRKQVQQLAIDYAVLVVTKEWPEMSHMQLSEAGQSTVLRLWDVLTHTPVQTLSQHVALQQAMTELDNLCEHRRIRRLEARTKMPTILWAVLVIGGVITIGACCLIGSENTVLHFALILALSLLISLSLITIGDIDRPFQGSVHVDPIPFLRVEVAAGMPMPASR